MGRLFFKNHPFFYGYVFILLLLASLISGCATPTVQRYDKISFSWTSDNHLPPEQRFLSLDVSPEKVIERLKAWVEEGNGKIIESKDNCNVIVQIQPNSKNNFLEARDIAEREWAAYDQNVFRKWEEGEWQELQQLSKNQVTFNETPNRQSICLKAHMGKREKQIKYNEQVGITRSYQQTYIYTKNGMIPGARIPMDVPKYETRISNVAFVSQIDFHIFSENGLTRIYATGAPLELGSKVKAAYGATVKHPCWPLITGKEEAAFIADAYNYLKSFSP